MDEREFEQRVRACTQKLFRICYAILPERADRDDAIQEALIKAWRRRRTLRDSALFEAWLTRIAINECKNILRRRKYAPTAELDESIPAPRDASPDPALRDALRSLDLKLRLPMVLHYVDGYTIAETARILGVPTGTIKHRLQRARTILKEQLKEE